MTRYMTDDEIAAEQLLLAQQQDVERMALEQAPVINDDEARSVTPLDLLSSANYSSREIRDSRLNVCMDCERLFRPTKTCRECGCFMAAKTWLKDASCPLGKW